MDDVAMIALAPTGPTAGMFTRQGLTSFVLCHYVVPSEHVARDGEGWHAWYKRAGTEFNDNWRMFETD